MNYNHSKMNKNISIKHLNHSKNNERSIGNGILYEIKDSNSIDIYNQISLKGHEDNNNCLYKGYPWEINLNEDNNDTFFFHENGPKKTDPSLKYKKFVVKKKKSCKKENQLTNEKRNRSNDKTISKKSNDNVINKKEKKEDKKEKEDKDFKNKIEEINYLIENKIENKLLDTDKNIVTIIKYLIFFILLNFNSFIKICFNKSKWKEIFEYYIQINTFPKNQRKTILNTIEKVLKINKSYTKSYELLNSQPYQYMNYIINKYIKKRNETIIYQIRANYISKIKGLIKFAAKKNSNKNEVDEIKNSHCDFDININNNNITNNENKDEKLNDYLTNNCLNENNKRNINNGEKNRADSTKNSTNETEEKEKKYRKDILSNRLKSMIKDEFFRNFYKLLPNLEEIIENENENQNIGKEVNAQIDKNFWDSDFTEIVNKLNIDIKGNKQASQLINKNKINFLAEIMKDEKKKKEFFEKDRIEQKKHYKNLKYKNATIEILESLNLDGLIILIWLLTIEEGQYIKIKNSEEFESAIKSGPFQNYNFNLTAKEEKEIENRIAQIKSIAEALVSSFKKREKKIKVNSYMELDY